MDLEQTDAQLKQPQSFAAEGVVATRIRQRMGTLTPSEKNVARTLLAAYPVAGFDTVASLAALAGVSGATVVRFTTRLGFSGFPDFQRALRNELEQRSASPARLFQKDPKTTPPADFSLAAQSCSDNVQATFAALVKHDFDQATAYLSHPKHSIWIAGGRYSVFLAEYFSASLQQLRPGVQMVPQMASLRGAALSQFGSRDVLVAFDFRRYEVETLRLIQGAKQRKSRVVLITDQWLSPGAHDADAVLSSVITEGGPFDSFVPVVALIETLCAATMHRIGAPAVDRIQQIETVAQELEVL